MSREVLSAAIDDNATSEEWDALLRSMEEDSELKAEWGRAWAARDARVRTGLSKHAIKGAAMAAPRDFAAGVMAAIFAEGETNPKVVDFAVRRAERVPAARPAAGRRLRTLIPVSAAAGVAAAVLTVNFMRAEREPAVAAVSVSSAAAPADGFQRVASQNVAGLSGESRERLEARRAALLNSYVMEHSNTVAERGMGGSLANARFAARTADYRPDAE